MIHISHARAIDPSLPNIMRLAAVVGIVAFLSFPVGPSSQEQPGEARRVRTAATVFDEIIGRPEPVALWLETLSRYAN